MSTAGPAGGETRAAAAFDVAEAMDGIPGDLETARELAGLFIEEYANVAAKMRQGLAAGNADAVRRGAHMLKSSAGVFAAHATVAAAERLESIAAAGDLAAAAEALADLQGEAVRLIEALKEHFGTT